MRSGYRKMQAMKSLVRATFSLMRRAWSAMGRMLLLVRRNLSVMREALAMLIIAMASHGVQFAIGHSLPLWLALIFLLAVYLVLGAWLFAERATNASGQVLGWRGGLRLSACAFSVMAVFALLLLGVSLMLHSFHPMTSP
jgi:hypothetical protein